MRTAGTDSHKECPGMWYEPPADLIVFNTKADFVSPWHRVLESCLGWNQVCAGIGEEFFAFGMDRICSDIEKDRIYRNDDRANLFVCFVLAIFDFNWIKR